MTTENRNLLLALVLSMVVMTAWYALFAGPELERVRREQEIAAEQAPPPAAAPIESPEQAAAPPAPVAAGAPTAASGVIVAANLSRQEALARSERVPIETDRLAGSINLNGALIDDLELTTYYDSVDVHSDDHRIVLLSPSGGPDAYFAEFGWEGVAVEADPYPGPETEWSAPAGARLTAERPVTLTYDNDAGLVFTRTIAVDDNYMFTITDAVANNGERTVAISPYGRVTRIGEPQAQGWWILHEGLIGVLGEDGLEEEKYKAIKDDRLKTWSGVAEGWLGITDKYWAAVMIPDQTQPFDASFAYADDPAPHYQTSFSGPAASLAPGARAEHSQHLFAGAKQVAVVDGYGETLQIKLFDRLIDWGWFYFITKPMFSAIDFFFRLFGNFGVAILAVTVLVKAAFFPLANKSYKSMSSMKKLQPQIADIRERYKDDKVKQQQAQMELFKKEKINPLAGCWPIAIQIPVFFALYKVLFVTIEMRHAPFFGWIKDLSAPDPTSVFNLFGLIPWDPSTAPAVGGLLMLGAWPLIMGISMFVQMRLNPTPPDPTQAMIFTWMPVVFTFMLASFPAGLVIYWAWNNTLSVTQQYVIMRRQGVDVDLIGNIRDSFRRRSKPAAGPASTPAGNPRPANDDKGSPADDDGEPKPATAARPRKADRPRKSSGKGKQRRTRAKARG